MENLIEILEQAAKKYPNTTAFTFLMSYRLFIRELISNNMHNNLTNDIQLEDKSSLDISAIVEEETISDMPLAELANLKTYRYGSICYN